MTITVKPLIYSKFAESTLTIQYTAVNCKAAIDKFTATNVSVVNTTIDVHIVNSGGTAGTDNLVVDSRVIAPGEAYTFPELAGHVLGSGDTIQTLAGAVDSLVIRASGREIT